jgi:hypothetical protein
MTVRVQVREGVGREGVLALGRAQKWTVRRDVARGAYNHGVVVWETAEGEEVRYVEDAALYARYVEGPDVALEAVREGVATWTRAELLEASREGSVVATLRLGAACEGGEDAEVVAALERALEADDVGLRRAALVVIEELGWAPLTAALSRAASDPVWGELAARLMEAQGGAGA